MPLVVNDPDPKSSGNNPGGIVIGNRPSKAASKSGARKAAAQAKADRTRIIVLTVVILVSLGAIGWYVLGTRKAPEMIASQRQVSGATPDSMARRPRSIAAGGVGQTPGMPAPSLPGGQAPRAAQPATGGEPESSSQGGSADGIH